MNPTRQRHTDMLAMAILLLVGCIWIAGCWGGRSANTGAPKEGYYTEMYRPAFHFTPEKGWMNDPNGMVYYEGEYHLFYQYYPDATVWGPMHWGHAVSKDLVHWTHLPIALYPDSLGYIFSGSAVVDWNNTSGFGRNGKPPLVAIFTIHDMKAEQSGSSTFQSQGIAFSNDNGRSWTKYEGNPVLPHTGNIRDFRDPKVIWYAPGKEWIMALAVQDHAEFWASKDLKKWSFRSAFGQALGAHGGVWECPDFFPMTLEGSHEQKWVLIQSLNPGGPNGGSAAQYFVGDFDGKTFTPDPACLAEAKTGKAQWMDYGKDNYAGVTWSDAPGGQRIFMGWMSNWQYAQVTPTDVWRSAMTLPRSLSLHRTPSGYRIYTQPVKSLEKLRIKPYRLGPLLAIGELNLNIATGCRAELLEMELSFDCPADEKGKIGIELMNGNKERYRIGYDPAIRQFFSDRSKAGKTDFSADFAGAIHFAPRLSADKKVSMRLFVDRSSVEMFADGGQVAMTELFFPHYNFDQIQFFAETNRPVSVEARIHSLKRIWK